LLLGLEKFAPSGELVCGQLYLFLSAVTYNTRPILAIVAIYSSQFRHSGVAKAYESCRNFVGTTVVIKATADGFFEVARWWLAATERCDAITHYR
jgi:hypothetical protein